MLRERLRAQIAQHTGRALRVREEQATVPAELRTPSGLQRNRGRFPPPISLGRGRPRWPGRAGRPSRLGRLRRTPVRRPGDVPLVPVRLRKTSQKRPALRVAECAAAAHAGAVGRAKPGGAQGRPARPGEDREPARANAVGQRLVCGPRAGARGPDGARTATKRARGDCCTDPSVRPDAACAPRLEGPALTFAKVPARFVPGPEPHFPNVARCCASTRGVRRRTRSFIPQSGKAPDNLGRFQALVRESFSAQDWPIRSSGPASTATAERFASRRRRPTGRRPSRPRPQPGRTDASARRRSARRPWRR
jgi:hypothetical protein